MYQATADVCTLTSAYQLVVTTAQPAVSREPA
jgi:hypothetical protein